MTKVLSPDKKSKAFQYRGKAYMALYDLDELESLTDEEISMAKARWRSSDGSNVTIQTDFEALKKEVIDEQIAMGEEDPRCLWELNDIEGILKSKNPIGYIGERWGATSESNVCAIIMEYCNVLDLDPITFSNKYLVR